MDAAGHSDDNFVNDLREGFPLTGVLGIGGLGTDIPGGQRSHGRPGLGGSPPLSGLRSQCREINELTIGRAVVSRPRTAEQWAVAHDVWQQVEKDVNLGRAGSPRPLESVNLGDVLLVNSFAIV